MLIIGLSLCIIHTSKFQNFGERTLTNDHIGEISKRLTNKNNLRDIAYKLKVESYVVHEALNDNRDSMRNAAEEVLHKWLLKQNNLKEAYQKMYTALKEAEMNLIIGEVLEKNNIID